MISRWQETKHIFTSVPPGCCRYWWYDVYNMCRRLLLTCAVLLMDSLASTTVFIVCVAIATLVIEQESKAYANPLLSAFTCIW